MPREQSPYRTHFHNVKPHLYKTKLSWWCVGRGLSGYGPTPFIAWAYWQGRHACHG